MQRLNIYGYLLQKDGSSLLYIIWSYMWLVTDMEIASNKILINFRNLARVINDSREGDTLLLLSLRSVTL